MLNGYVYSGLNFSCIKTTYEHKLLVLYRHACLYYYVHLFNQVKKKEAVLSLWHPLKYVQERGMVFLECIAFLMNLVAVVVYFPTELLKNIIFLSSLEMIAIWFKLF